MRYLLYKQIAINFLPKICYFAHKITSLSFPSLKFSLERASFISSLPPSKQPNYPFDIAQALLFLFGNTNCTSCNNIFCKMLHDRTNGDSEHQSSPVKPVAAPRKRSSITRPPLSGTSLPPTIPEEETTPPPVPAHGFTPEPPASPSVSLIHCPPNVSNNIDDHQWFWGNVTRDEVNECMRDRRDGTFLVRNTNTQGDYTLTLRKDTSNKLIKIYGRDGKYGFSITETLRFTSVPALIEHYKNHSLKNYNRNLDIMLLFPLSRAGEEDEQGHSAEQLCQVVLELHEDYLRSSSKYDVVYEYFSTKAHELRNKRQALQAFNETLNVFNQQLKLLDQYGGEASGCMETRQVEEKRTILEERIATITQHRNALQDAITTTGEEYKQLERQVNEIKPRLLKLYRRRDRYQWLLLRKGMSHAAVQELLKDIAAKVKLHQPSSSNSVEYSGKHEDYVQEEEERAGKLIVSEFWKHSHLWLVGSEVTKPQAQQLLAKCRDGSFLIRPSITRPGYYALCVVCDSHPVHCLVECSNGGFGFHATSVLFATLGDFVKHYACNSLVEHNPALDIVLKYPVNLTHFNVA